MDVVKNKTSLFLLPMYQDIPSIYLNGYLNAYVGRRDVVFDEDCIYIAFKVEDLEKESYEVDGKVILNEDRISFFNDYTHFLYSEVVKDFFLVALSIPKPFKDDLNTFKRGAYSKLSGRLKNILLRKFKSKELKGIINPTKEVREALGRRLMEEIPDDSEVFDVPDMLEETFFFSNFVKV